MLHTLLEFARAAEISAEAGFKPKRVRWLLQFSPDGEYLGLVPASDNPRGREFPKVPHLQFSGDTKMRQFLVDTAQYVMLYGEQEVSDKLLAKHTFFLDQLRAAAEAEPVLERIAESLANPTVRRKIHRDLDVAVPKAKSSDNVTFAEITENTQRIIVEEDTWPDWWRAYWPGLFAKKKGKAGKITKPMRCLLTGELIEAAPTHPKIKGLGDVGGNVETTLVGFNQDAFRSHGLMQSANAAVSTATAETYAAALNQLIAENSRRLAGAKVVYWYTHEVPLDPLGLVLDGPEFEDTQDDGSKGPTKGEIARASRRAAELLDAVSSGEAGALDGVKDCRFRAMTLCGNAGRVVVRDWMEGTFEKLVSRTKQWFADLRVVHRRGESLAPDPKFLAVLAATVRDLKEVHRPLETALWRSAVLGTSIPVEAMAQTLVRVRIDIIKDSPARHARLGLLKAYLIRKGIAHMKPCLNEEENHPAYLCGRIMAVLASIQRRALPDVGAGVVERYYAAASATPALVLGRLVRLAQTGHLPKIEVGLRRWFDMQLADIWARLETCPPAALTLEEQSLFAMGYYQQLAHRPAKASGPGNADVASASEVD